MFNAVCGKRGLGFQIKLPQPLYLYCNITQKKINAPESWLDSLGLGALTTPLSSHALNLL